MYGDVSFIVQHVKKKLADEALTDCVTHCVLLIAFKNRHVRILAFIRI